MPFTGEMPIIAYFFEGLQKGRSAAGAQRPWFWIYSVFNIHSRLPFSEFCKQKKDYLALE